MAASAVTRLPGFLSCLQMWFHQAGYILTSKHRPGFESTNPTWQRRLCRFWVSANQEQPLIIGKASKCALAASVQLAGLQSSGRRSEWEIRDAFFCGWSLLSWLVQIGRASCREMVKGFA